MEQKEIQGRKTQLLIPFTLLLIFVIPLVLAWILYKEGDQSIHKTTNYGTLLNPPIDMTQLKLKAANGQSYEQKSLRGKWLMLYVIPHTCGKICQNKLYYMRQIRLATGKNMDRVERVVLIFSHKKIAGNLNKLLQTNYAGTITVLSDPKQFQKIMSNTKTVPLAMTQGYLYLVDPLGNIMMGYSVNSNPSGIFKDLQKLLRVSQIG